MEFFDTHVHLDDEQFGEDVEGVVARAQAAGVTTLIAMGTTAESSRACLELAERFPGVYAAVGIQPNYAHQATEDDWQEIMQMAEHPRVVAIGETGLDRYWDYCPWDVQLDWFERQVRLSQQSGKPFIVHMRDCEQELIEVLQGFSQNLLLNGIMHSFTGSLETAQAALAMGLDISFAGMLTFKKSDDLREVARGVPADRLLLETDAPYLSPHPHRGRRPNEPALLVHTAACLAETRGVDLATIATQTTANARRRFGLLD